MKAYIDKYPDRACGDGDVNAELFPGITEGLRSLTLFFQPIFNSASHRVIGVEALARFLINDEYILTGELIRHLEEPEFASIYSMELISRLQEFIIQQRNKLDSGFTFSLNLCLFQLCDRTLIQRLVQLKKIAGNNIHIQVEIVERHIHQEMGDDVIEASHFLNQQGIKISLDDFGVESSAFDYLNLVEVDTIKLDKSLTRCREQTLYYKKILQGLLAASRAMNVILIAEGVESEYQKQQLERLGIYLHQGFYYSRPVSMAAFADMLH
jgi:EAL domain-containing protein (putative c-di-GMP-specific phosphodiesterase class I)